MNLDSGFHLGDWDVLPLEGRIVPHGGGDAVRVRRKAMDVLCALAARAGQVVERDALLAEVWGRAVSDEPLTSTIGELRRLLGERDGERRYIETIPKRGYRLLVDVIPLADPADVPAPESTLPGASRRPPRVRRDWRAALALLVVLAMAVALTLRFAVFERPSMPVPERSVAVLPFDDLSPDGDQGYFADGLAEELMALLSRLTPLRVAARTSAFAFRGQSLPAAEIATQLKVAHLLTGSVRRLGNRVRVSAQLVDARTGYQLWSATYDRTVEDIFAIQDDIAGAVTQQLQIALLGGDLSVRETDPRAYSLYLQARHVARQHTGDSLEQAVNLYRQALDIDPTYLPAWEELAGVYSNLAGFVLMPRQEAFGLARAAALAALAVDPNYGPAHGRLGWLAMYEATDLVVAAEHFRRALDLDPSNEALRSNAAVLLVALGRLDDAIAYLEVAADHDPVSATAHANLANAYLLARRFGDAEESIRRAITLSPAYAGAHYRLGRALLAQGEVAAAEAAFAGEPLPAGLLIGQALVANARGDAAAADAALADLEGRFGDQAAGNYAQILADRGELDAAFAWLEVELATGGAGGFLEYRWDPLFDPLRSDPRWADLMSRAGFGDEEIAAIEFPALVGPGD